jgi:hypothetical protein
MILRSSSRATVFGQTISLPSLSPLKLFAEARGFGCRSPSRVWRQASRIAGDIHAHIARAMITTSLRADRAPCLVDAREELKAGEMRSPPGLWMPAAMPPVATSNESLARRFSEQAAIDTLADSNLI